MGYFSILEPSDADMYAYMEGFDCEEEAPAPVLHFSFVAPPCGAVEDGEDEGLHGTKKPHEVTCRECLQLLKAGYHGC